MITSVQKQIICDQLKYVSKERHVGGVKKTTCGSISAWVEDRCTVAININSAYKIEQWIRPQ